MVIHVGEGSVIYFGGVGRNEELKDEAQPNGCIERALIVWRLEYEGVGFYLEGTLSCVQKEGPTTRR